MIDKVKIQQFIDKARLAPDNFTPDGDPVSHMIEADVWIDAIESGEVLTFEDFKTFLVTFDEAIID
tara:strand:- start:296 stop:493 length:198 start_codon:yes stop_codon:yes gene_type:complete